MYINYNYGYQIITWPSCPCINSTTLDGNESSSTRSWISFVVKLFCTINCARSPTTFDDGVTLIKSPRSWFASIYAFLILSNCEPRPRLKAWN
jgi:hypothetical protein